jgi:hypothetical protein
MNWCLGTELNRRHGDFQSPALPTELPKQIMATSIGFEPTIFAVTGRHVKPLHHEASWAASAPVEINQWIRHIFDDDNQRVSDHPEPLYDVSVGDGRVLRSRGKSDSILLLGMIR